MSDVRSRLADAIADELEIRRGTVQTWGAHIADVLLSLPGIAIVEGETLAELRGQLEAKQLLLEETQRQLSEFIADFCALRDALPRDQVEQVLSTRSSR
jgi:hypothetical protein